MNTEINNTESKKADTNKAESSTPDIEQADAKGKILLEIARDSINNTLGGNGSSSEAITQAKAQDVDWLQEKGACFVTLMQGTQLRGCIGSLEARRSLIDDVISNSKAAALKDSRFSPLTRDELNITQIEISVLSTLQSLKFKDQQDALIQLQPGLDGVVFEYTHHRATFLPQVWQQLPEPEDFMSQLKLKAGLSADFWVDEVKLSRYGVIKWKESDFDILHTIQPEVVSEV